MLRRYFGTALVAVVLSLSFALSCSKPPETALEPPPTSVVAVHTSTSVVRPTRPGPARTSPLRSNTPTAAPPTRSPAPTSTAVSTPVEQTTPSPVGRHGGTLRLVSRGNILHQDVHQEVSPALSTWGPGIVYSRLLRFSAGPEVELPSLVVECELCTGWTMRDELTFDFELRDEIRWQGLSPVDGRPLRAGDIAFSLNRQRQEGWPNEPLLHILSDVTALDDRTVRVSLKAPDADFMIGLADGHTKIVSSEAVGLTGDLREGPTVGSGPWVLTETQPDLWHRFDRNPDYFEEGLPYLDKVVINIISDDDTRRAAFRVNRLDVDQMEPREWEEFSSRSPGMSFLLARETARGIEVAFKTTSPPFEDVRIRRAAMFAMDPFRAIDEVWRGAAYVSQGMPTLIPNWGLSREELGEFFGDRQRALELITESGLDVPIPVTIRVGDFSEAVREHAELIQRELARVGFLPTIELVNRRRFGDEVWLGGDYQMFIGPIAPTTSTNGYLLPIIHSKGRWNTTGHRNDSLDALIEAQAQMFDPSERMEFVHEIQRRILRDAYRFMPATQVSIWTWWPEVENLDPNFAGFEYSHWSRVWLRR